MAGILKSEVRRFCLADRHFFQMKSHMQYQVNRVRNNANYFVRVSGNEYLRREYEKSHYQHSRRSVISRPSRQPATQRT
jgi:hypothetical protein